MLGRVKSAKPEEEIVVTAGTETKDVLPASGKVIKRVTVKPTPSQIKSVTPAAAPQEVVPDSGKLLSKVTVAGDADLAPENVRKGTDIFGVLGSFDNSAGAYVWKKYNVTSGEQTFIGYIVSDNESEYPDGGTQGGYYYERVAEEPELKDYIAYADYGSDGRPQSVIMKVDPGSVKSGDAGLFQLYNSSDSEMGIYKFHSLRKYTALCDGVIPESSFAYLLSYTPGHAYYATVRLKIKAKGIGQLAFQAFNAGIGDYGYVWISKDVEIIDCTSYSNSPFCDCGINTIYCEAESAPAGYKYYWNSYSMSKKFTTVWGVSESDFDASIN